MLRCPAGLVLAVLALLPLLGSLLLGAAGQPSPALPPGTIITVAGSGKAGFSGDGCPAIQARLNNPVDVTIDGIGNLFIADGYNARVRRVSPDGTITTVAGRSSTYGFSGDSGPATQARLAEAAGVAVDAAGDLFIADADNFRVRKVDPAAIINTVAGGGHPSDGVGDGGPATKAALADPTSIAVDPSGNLYIADFLGQRLRKVDPNGIITTVAGGGRPADGRGDGGPATDARLAGPYRMTRDRAGNLYICDWSEGRVRRVAPDGRIATIAGGGNPAQGVGDYGPATTALLEGPAGVVVDAGGNLFISENYGDRIRKVSPSGIITTVAGTGEIGYTGDGGPAIAARLNSPHGVWVDRTGNLFFAEGNRYHLPTQPGGPPDFKNTPGSMVVREVIGVAVPQ